MGVLSPNLEVPEQQSEGDCQSPHPLNQNEKHRDKGGNFGRAQFVQCDELPAFWECTC